MNLVLLEPEDFVSDTTSARLTGRRLAHVRAVHRADVGDEIRVGLVGGKVGRGTITRLDADVLELAVVLDADPPPASTVKLVLALPRPKVLRRVLGAATAMGVKRIVLLHTWRVEKSYWESPVLEAAALRAALVLGLEQARDTILPEVLQRRRFRPFVEDELPAIARNGPAFVAHPGGDTSCPRAVAGPVTLAIGPEGGFVAFELGLLAAAGFAPVSLGPRPLRVEHAVPALLARLG